MTIFRPFSIDFEATGLDTATAHPIEVGVSDPRSPHAFESFIALPPGASIPVETSAVHHIIEEDLRGAPTWREVLVQMETELELDDQETEVLLIAHNAEYEQGILADTRFRDVSLARDGFPGVPWICTFKCALVAWPDAPSHKNEGLRYWLGIGRLGRSANNAAHSALHDAEVTAGIFRALVGFFYAELASAGKLDGSLPIHDPLNEEVIFNHMIAISREVAVLPTCPIGKERGKKWADIDAGFLSWTLRQPDMREDVKAAATRELARRREQR